MRRALLPAAVMVACVVLVGGCRQETTTPATSPVPTAGRQTPPPAVELKDVVITDPRFVVGISYPPGLGKHAGLATALKAYSEQAQADLKQAVDALGTQKPTAPYDLTLSYSVLLDTPDIVAVAGDGSTYTGGAHSAPLVARFVWLPKAGKLLDAATLLRDDGLAPLSARTRKVLMEQLDARMEADDVPQADRAAMREGASRMIDEGTQPTAASFRQFEPVAGPSGKLKGLRFVFPPYQVGPYSDGTQTVEVPAAELLPLIATEYRSLFEGG